MSQAPKNYNWIIDNTNVIEAHEVISGHFSQGAIAVNVELLLNNESIHTQVLPWENIYVVMNEIIEEELRYANLLKNIEISFVSCEKE